MPTTEDARDWLAHALENDELAHYGILGMKWGVRKDTLKGRSKGNTATFSKVALKTTGKTVKVSKTEDTKMSTGDKVLLGSLGVGSVGIVFADDIATVVDNVSAQVELPKLAKELKDISDYTSKINKAKEFITDTIDTTLPANTTFNRIASTVETTIDKPKFATYLADDVLSYRSSWSNLNAKLFARQYITKMTAVKDIKIASPENTRKVLEEGLDQLLANKETLRQMYVRLNHLESISGQIRNARVGWLAEEILSLNKANVWADDLSKASAEILRKAGYSAITDTWDTGYIAKHAVIVIDNDAFNLTSTKLKASTRAAAKIAAKSISKTGTYIPSATTKRVASAITALSNNKIAQRFLKTAIKKKL